MRLKGMNRNLLSFLFLAVLGMAAAQARAQNQTPTNAPQPVGWTDPATGLTWTMQDNGSNVNWNQAITYCTNLRLGGYSGWRLPTIDELQAIYDASVIANSYRVKGNLKLTNGYQWSSSQGSAPAKAWYFFFGNGRRYLYRISDSNSDRALCVRHE